MTQQMTHRDSQIFPYLTISDQSMQLTKSQSLPLDHHGFAFDTVTMSMSEIRALGEHGKQICDSTIMGYCKLVQLRDNQMRNDKKTYTVLLDSHNSRKLLKPDTRSKHKDVARYISRDMTRDTHSVIIPFHIEAGAGSHWFLVICDVVNGKITAYETLYEDRTEYLKLVQTLFQSHWAMICRGRVQPKWTLKSIQPPETPFQNDAFSCGVYVCIFIDMYCMGILNRNMASLVNNRNIAEIRRRMALFMHGFNYM